MMTQAAIASKNLCNINTGRKKLTISPFLAGLLIPFGFAPFHLPGLAFIGIAVLFGLVQHTNFKYAFRIGFIFGLGYLGLGVSWVYVSIHEYGHLHELLSALVTLFFLVFLSLYPALAAGLFAIFSKGRSRIFSCFLFSALWCLFEWLRANSVFGGFPWLLLGFGQMDTPLKNLLPLIGIYGVGFIACFISTLLTMGLSSRHKYRYLWFILMVIILLSPAALKNMEWTTLSDTPITVGIVQANLSMRDKWDEALFWQLLQNYKENLEALVGKNQLVVLPESAIPLPESYLSDYLDAIHYKAKEIGSAVLLGIPQATTSDESQYYNTMTSLGEAEGSYLKQHLVPFGEFIPSAFNWIFDWLSLPKANMKPGGKKQALIQVQKHPIATLICYELAYPQLLREQLPEAEWIVSISDDGWFGHSFAMYQHLQLAQVVSLQMSRYQIVANNDGLSSVINQYGDIIASLPAFESGRLEASIYPATGASPWVVLGDTPTLALIALIILSAVFLKMRR
jgi:apolipoprotein N-acyltransferase